MSHTLKHRGPIVGASMWSLLQLLTKGGLNYLVAGAIPHANKRITFRLGLVAHSYQPDRFRGYLHRMGIVYNRPLIMNPWNSPDILKVAARMHPQLISSLVSWRQRALAHAQVFHVTLLLAMHLQRGCFRPKGCHYHMLHAGRGAPRSSWRQPLGCVCSPRD